MISAAKLNNQTAISDASQPCAAAKRPPLRVSVVMPVLNAGHLLEECIKALKESSYPVWEIIVVDDGSTDESAMVARGLGCVVVATEGRLGPGAARNLGASRASGDVLFFIDADVVVRSNTVERVISALDDTGLDGVMAVQDPCMRFDDACSRYKNLWMYHTYAVRAGDAVPLFYTTAAAIRRKAFLAAGGFDLNYGTPNIEDTDFGQKLASLGYRITVDQEALVEHVKKYSLRSLLRADWARSVALARLKLRKRRETLAVNNTSVPTSYIFSVPLAVLGALLLLVGLLASSTAIMATGLLALAVTWAMNARFLSVLARVGGLSLLLKGMVLIVVELLTVAVAGMWGVGSYVLGRAY